MALIAEDDHLCTAGNLLVVLDFLAPVVGEAGQSRTLSSRHLVGFGFLLQLRGFRVTAREFPRQFPHGDRQLHKLGHLDLRRQ